MILANEHRIKSSKRIEQVKKEGKLLQSENFGTVVLKRDDKEPSQFAFVISTKVSKLAVHRNRISRAFNEGVRRNLSITPMGWDVVILTKKSIASKSTEEIMREVERFIADLKKTPPF
ncbi:ribonuclease P protein component [Candidatus Woesebacteria bacterium RIFCSPHIGHO2_01_FULL_38_9]|uniref:Ribonuclease P protein component n=2 Tax=Candidatus Woeseibacteriota TaxID=1752722 RepID=A0A1F7Y0E8_9BACT|nr:MAG: ribonuclease P protein component [Candidatus Woesebacteria bacterium RIFCSPHIGHO2_01_FULL_38_9]OGM59151.1 MAG: ribonuclease P protein component [Candidatus Woesebacteria bacterium RIFCSPLOWO2_01_FULL_39_10]